MWRELKTNISNQLSPLDASNMAAKKSETHRYNPKAFTSLIQPKNMDVLIRKRQELVQKISEKRRKFKDELKTKKVKRDRELIEQLSLSVKGVFITILEEKRPFATLPQIQEERGT
jgi:hypothetical protein